MLAKSSIDWRPPAAEASARFKLDENLPYRAATTFLEAGHDADTVYDEDLAGQPDEVVLAAAVSENRVLVTLDLDSSDLRAYPVGTHCGIVVLRPLDDSRAAPTPP